MSRLMTDDGRTECEDRARILETEFAKKKLLTVPNLEKIYTVMCQIWGNSAAALRGLWQPSQFQFHQESESTETAMLSNLAKQRQRQKRLGRRTATCAVVWRIN